MDLDVASRQHAGMCSAKAVDSPERARDEPPNLLDELGKPTVIDRDEEQGHRSLRSRASLPGRRPASLVEHPVEGRPNSRHNDPELRLPARQPLVERQAEECPDGNADCVGPHALRGVELGSQAGEGGGKHDCLGRSHERGRRLPSSCGERHPQRPQPHACDGQTRHGEGSDERVGRHRDHLPLVARSGTAEVAGTEPSFLRTVVERLESTARQLPDKPDGR